MNENEADIGRDQLPGQKDEKRSKVKAHLQGDGVANVEGSVPVVHDAVAVVLRVKRKLERVPGVVDPLVRQHVEVVDVHVLASVEPGVGVQHPHVVQQLVSDDTHLENVSSKYP